MIRIINCKSFAIKQRWCFNARRILKQFAKSDDIIRMSLDTYLTRLKEQRHRATPKVRAVIQLFLEQGSVLDPFEVQAKLQKEFRGVGLPTVYRILEGLAGCGILLTAANDDRELRYYICRGIEEGHHHHFICRKCGKVEEVNLCLMEEVTKYVKRHLKATVEDHFLQIEGLCAKCG
jgi:Fe2+ or Zn2+ uptake regulation protein